MAKKRAAWDRLTVDRCMVAMRDGTRLATEVIRVDGGSPRPALLLRTPYGIASLRATADPVALARSGWSVVLQDVRGRFESEGRFEPYVQEIADGADTVAWCAAQPWSDGKVAMTGGSYVGAVQWLAAMARPPALRAIMPMIAPAEFRDGWTYEGGAYRAGFMVPWVQGFAATDPRATARTRQRALELGRRPDKLLRLPLADGRLGRWFPAHARWVADDAAYWRQIDVRRAARRLDVPALHIGGWHDIFCEGTLAAYDAMVAGAASERARRSQRLIIGAWPHTGIGTRFTAGYDFGPAADGTPIGFPQVAFEWLRRAVDGKDVDGGVTAYVMGADTWVDLDRWPPPRTEHVLYLGDGSLLERPPEETACDGYRYDPGDPVPTWGGRVVGPYLPTAGPMEQAPVEARPDVVVYTGEPLTRTLVVAGEVTAKIAFSTSASSADVTVKLVDVHPDGRSYNIVDSIRRMAFTPGRTRYVDVVVGSTAHAFLPGHRVRIQVSSSNFPRLDRNPAPADQRVHRGGRRPSGVTIPVCPALKVC